ncbi:MAG: flagellar basal body P-ring protein FlgI [Alphaproteobacteria bacterium]
MQSVNGLGKCFSVLLSLAVILAAPFASAIAASRIKDLANLEGVRDNQLVGYGLVVGLNGTGDALANAPFTRQSLQAMLERLGVNTRDSTMRTKNVAAVMVTGNLPAFAAQGTRMDVTVSALGDASSLQGGTLLVTPLLGADGEVYSVAQGPVAVAGFTAQGDAASITQGVPTVGRIANGALIEREIGFNLASARVLRLSLRNPDLTTAKRMAQAINRFLGGTPAQTINPATVQISVPRTHKNMIELLTDIEQLLVQPDQPARVVIDERSGIIVIGANVRVSRVAIAQGNLTVTISESPQVSQPAPFSRQGQTAVVPRTQIDVQDDSEKRLAIVGDEVSLQQLVNGLNALGVGPRDMIPILQAIKASGALQAEIEVM